MDDYYRRMEAQRAYEQQQRLAEQYRQEELHRAEEARQAEMRRAEEDRQRMYEYQRQVENQRWEEERRFYEYSEEQNLKTGYDTEYSSVYGTHYGHTSGVDFSGIGLIILLIGIGLVQCYAAQIVAFLVLTAGTAFLSAHFIGWGRTFAAAGVLAYLAVMYAVGGLIAVSVRVAILCVYLLVNRYPAHTSGDAAE